MPQMRRGLIVLCATAGAITACAQAQALSGQGTAPSAPQLVPRTPEQRERTYEANRRINLHVLVTDASGKPVAGLRPQDFIVLDRGQPLKIVAFEEASKRASDSMRGLVVLDAINGGSTGVNRVRNELARLLGQGHGPLAYPLEIVVVSDAGVNQGRPTTDRSVLIAELTQLTRKVHSTDCDVWPEGRDIADSRMGPSFGQVGSFHGGWDCLNAHLTESLNALNRLAEEQQRASAPAIVIWTGPGWPMPRDMTTGQIMPGGGTTGDLSDAIVALEAGMQAGLVTLDAVSWRRFERATGVRRTGFRGSPAGASIPEQEAALELPALAEQTGGLALEKSKDLADALSTCLRDGERYYSLAFDPAPAEAQDEYRSIEVKVDRPGATVRTLTGYYAEP